MRPHPHTLEAHTALLVVEHTYQTWLSTSTPLSRVTPPRRPHPASLPCILRNSDTDTPPPAADHTETAMPVHLRRLPTGTALLRAPSRTLRTAPSTVRQRTLCAACGHRTTAQPRPRAVSLQHAGRRPNTAPRIVVPATFAAGQRRRASAVAAATIENSASTGGDERLGLENQTDAYSTANAEDIGPIQEYDRRVDNHLLRNDEHQRGESQLQ